MSGMLDAARAGIGLAPLSCFMADVKPTSRQLRGPQPEPVAGLRVLNDRDLRRTALIRAFLDAAAVASGGFRDLLEGRCAFPRQPLTG